VNARSNSLHLPLFWAAVTAAILVWGSHAHLERYITPQRGLGYALGITGGSMMLALLLYSLRKRLPNWKLLGKIPAWFQVHMVFGIVGPVLVLFHSNFSRGATNSNVALYCMLLVAGSGIVGRYFYVRLHEQLNGREQSLELLQSASDTLRSQHSKIAFMPNLMSSLEHAEAKMFNPPAGVLGSSYYLLTTGTRVALVRWKLRRKINASVRRASRDADQRIASHAKRLAMAANRYVELRLQAGRKVVEFRIYTNLFSFWHLLHLPLFIMLIIAGTVHVIAVSIY
jgi:hypothetical protein